MPFPADFTVRHEAKRQALLDARMAIAVLEAEVRTYDEIAVLFQAQQPEVLAPPAPPVPVQHSMPWPPSTPRSHHGKGKRSNKLQDKPRTILLALAAAYPQTCDMASLIEAVSRAKQTMRPNTLRASLAHHVKLGHIERVAPGVFRATAAGAKAAGTTLKE